MVDNSSCALQLYISRRLLSSPPLHTERLSKESLAVSGLTKSSYRGKKKKNSSKRSLLQHIAGSVELRTVGVTILSFNVIMRPVLLTTTFSLVIMCYIHNVTF